MKLLSGLAWAALLSLALALTPQGRLQGPVQVVRVVDGDTVKCDPAYPTVCISPPPPDLDCGDIPFRNFKVLPPDPHRFDRDRDGVGCEAR